MKLILWLFAVSLGVYLPSVERCQRDGKGPVGDPVVEQASHDADTPVGITLREAERKQRLCQKHSRCRESNGYFFTAETNSIMGRRISSFIPSMSIISFGGCGSTMC